MSNYCEFNISFKDLDLRTRCILFVKYLFPMLDIHSKTWKYSKLVKVYRILLFLTKTLYKVVLFVIFIWCLGLRK